MEYVGDLYAKIANKYIKISDSQTFDNLVSENKTLLKGIDDLLMQIETLKQQVKDLSWYKLEIGVSEPKIGQKVDAATKHVIVTNLEYFGKKEFIDFSEKGGQSYFHFTHWRLSNLPV